ncbi:hypothetical protein [Rhodococcus sp. USK10]|nr:hypothetical protein [Rhodococcus sp. USK10]
MVVRLAADTAGTFALPLVGAFVPMAAMVAWISMSMELFFTPG